MVASNQEWKCGKCNNILDASYEVDHITPLYKGGSNDESNLKTKLTGILRNKLAILIMMILNSAMKMNGKR